MVFVIISFIFMYIGRKVGWILSRAFLYSATKPAVIITCVIWGSFVALAIFFLIGYYHPHWILKIIFGYGLGAYVAIPNFGLVMESTIPDQARPGHELISNLPLLIYIFVSAGLAFLV